MYLFTKQADDLLVIFPPEERIRLGDTLFIDGVVAQVVDVRFADVPGILEHILRKSLIGETDTQQDVEPELKNYLNQLTDQKLAVAKIRGRIVNTEEQEGSQGTFKTGLSEFNISRARADIRVLGQRQLFDALKLPILTESDFCETLSSEPQPFTILAERLGINLVTGMKNSGKSYFSKRLLLKLIEKGVLTLVFDLNGEYLNLWKDESNSPNRYGSGHVIKIFTPKLSQAGANELPFRIPLSEIGFDDFAMLVNISPEQAMWQELMKFWSARGRSQFDLADLKKFVEGINQEHIRGALLRRIETAEALRLFGPSDLISTVKSMQSSGGGAIIFNLSRVGTYERDKLVQYVFRTLVKLGQKREIKPISLFLEEAQLYVDRAEMVDILTRMRHLGLFPTFITNDPRTLPDEVYTLLDNLIGFMFRNQDELRQLARSGLVDYNSIDALRYLEQGQCIAVGDITSHYPLFLQILPQKGVKMGGETRRLIG